MLKILISFLLLILVSKSVDAASGCIDVNRTRIYTSFQNGQGYWRSSTFSTAPNGCLYIYTGSICSIGFAGANNGYLGDTLDPQECPIDTYTLLLVLLCGGAGYLALSKLPKGLIFSS